MAEAITHYHVVADHPIQSLIKTTMAAMSSYASTMKTRIDLLSHLYSKPLQRIQVLGDNSNSHSGPSHTGCILNVLSTNVLP